MHILQCFNGKKLRITYDSTKGSEDDGQSARWVVHKIYPPVFVQALRRMHHFKSEVLRAATFEQAVRGADTYLESNWKNDAGL